MNIIQTNYLPYFKFLTRRDMEKKGFVLLGRLYTDGQRHHLKKKDNPGSYIASIESCDSENLILFCSYGLIDSNEQHNFSCEVLQKLIILT